MKIQIFAILLITVLMSSPVASAQQDSSTARPDSLKTIFSPFFDTAIQNDGSIKRDLNGFENPISTALSSGLSLVTLVKLYDLYSSSEFIDKAAIVSDYLATSLNDPRYPLIATYHDADGNIISNYRSVVDNFLIAWGLSELAERIDPENELAKKIQQERSDFVSRDISLFDKENGFAENIRVDQETSTNTYNIFSNLMSAFIITESQSDIFNQYEEKPETILTHVNETGRTSDGGVHTLIFNEFSDQLISLRNTALFANLALNLYTETDNTDYLTLANQSMQYIQDEFYDIGVTGGYFETILDGVPVQQSKSLFSHALILQLLIRLANLGDNNARLNLLSLWRTISQYFRISDQSALFYSTLNRAGESASSVINSVDNLMMIYTMRDLPLFSTLNYTKDVEFSDTIDIDVKLQVPKNINSNLIIKIDGVEVDRQTVSGQSDLQDIDFQFDPIRPENEVQGFDYEFILSSEGVVTDKVEFTINVSLAPGVDLSLGVISIFSIMAVVIFTLFMRRYGDFTTA